VAARSRTQDDRGIDDVGCTPDPAQLAGLARTLIVQRFDLDPVRSQEPRESSLPPSIAPHLTDDSGGHGQRVAMLEALGDQRHDLPVVALECDERAGIQRQSRHGLLSTPSL